MLDPATQVVLFQFFLGAAMLAFGYGYIYRRMKVDRFREDIFSLRDELFDYMWKRDVSFSHPAYLHMRAAMNGAIRFGGLWNLGGFVVMIYYANRQPSQTTLTDAIGSLPLEHQRYFVSVRRRVWNRLIVYLFHEGVCGWTLGSLRFLARQFRGDNLSNILGLNQFADSVTDELVLVGESRSQVARSLFDDRAA